MSVPIKRTKSVLIRKTMSVPIKKMMSVPIRKTKSVPIRKTKSVPIWRTMSVPIRKMKSVPIKSWNRKVLVILRSASEVTKDPRPQGKDLIARKCIANILHSCQQIFQRQAKDRGSYLAWCDVGSASGQGVRSRFWHMIGYWPMINNGPEMIQFENATQLAFQIGNNNVYKGGQLGQRKSVWRKWQFQQSATIPTIYDNFNDLRQSVFLLSTPTGLGGFSHQCIRRSSSSSLAYHPGLGGWAQQRFFINWYSGFPPQFPLG